MPSQPKSPHLTKEEERQLRYQKAEQERQEREERQREKFERQRQKLEQQQRERQRQEAQMRETSARIERYPAVFSPIAPPPSQPLVENPSHASAQQRKPSLFESPNPFALLDPDAPPSAQRVIPPSSITHPPVKRRSSEPTPPLVQASAHASRPRSYSDAASSIHRLHAAPLPPAPQQPREDFPALSPKAAPQPSPRIGSTYAARAALQRPATLSLSKANFPALPKSDVEFPLAPPPSPVSASSFKTVKSFASVASGATTRGRSDSVISMGGK